MPTFTLQTGNHPLAIATLGRLPNPHAPGAMLARRVFVFCDRVVWEWVCGMRGRAVEQPLPPPFSKPTMRRRLFVLLPHQNRGEVLLFTPFSG